MTERSVRQGLKEMSPKLVDKEKKREKILLAAIETIAKKGIKNTKIADIAKQAGIGKGTIYEYFKSRDEIFIESFNFFLIDMEKKFRQEISVDKLPIDKLKNILDILFFSLSQISVDLIPIFIDFWSEGIRSSEADKSGLLDLKKLYRNFRLKLKQILDDGVKSGVFNEIDTSVTASTILAAVDGLLLQWIIDPDAFDLSTLSKKTFDLFIDGIKK